MAGTGLNTWLRATTWRLNISFCSGLGNELKRQHVQSPCHSESLNFHRQPRCLRNISLLMSFAWLPSVRRYRFRIYALSWSLCDSGRTLQEREAQGTQHTPLNQHRSNPIQTSWSSHSSVITSPSTTMSSTPPTATCQTHLLPLSLHLPRSSHYPSRRS